MKTIPFTKFIPLYFLISGVVIAAGVTSLVLWGLRPAIDFVGGSLIQVSIKATGEQKPSESAIRETLQTVSIDAHSVQPASSGLSRPPNREAGDEVGHDEPAETEEWIIRTRAQGEDVENQAKQALASRFGDTDISRFESIGPTLGRELLTKTIYAILISAFAILLFVAWRFRGGKYGVCADLAMIHDSLVVIGTFSLLGHFYGMEIDTLFVTALLTILSFSVHDTIVVYDRIRENLRRFPKESFDSIVNRSLTETMGRSINNSLTIIFMLTALVVLGGLTIKPFAIALLVGTVTGTYSSPFTAAPLLVVWNRIEESRKKKQ